DRLRPGAAHAARYERGQHRKRELEGDERVKTPGVDRPFEDASAAALVYTCECELPKQVAESSVRVVVAYGAGGHDHQPVGGQDTNRPVDEELPGRRKRPAR